MSKKASAQVRSFRVLADEYLAARYERFPEEASHLGLSEFNHRLGKNDVAVRREQMTETRRAITAVEALAPSAFEGDDKLDRRAFLSMLRVDELFSKDLPRWRDNPQVHCDTAVESLFDLVVRHIGQLPVVSSALEARLAKIPDFLEAGANCVRKPVPLWTGLAKQACQGACVFLDELEQELTAASKSPKHVAGLISSAKRAFENYAEKIAKKPQGSPNGFCVGRTVFEFLMRERLGFEMSLPEARAEGLRRIELLTQEVADEARKLGFSSAREAIEKASQDWMPDKPLLEVYASTTESLKTAVRKLGLATIPKGETLNVLPAPPFLRHQFPTAAYSAPPPFSKKQTGIFWVNDLSLGVSRESARRAEIRQHFGLDLTSVHEAYPGHHLQFAVQNRHPSKLRRLFAHSIFYEGWTMWCEKLAVDLGLVKHPAARLIQLHDALWRAYRIVIDCGLHSGELTHSAAARLLMKGVGFTMARARGDVNWYTSSPTVPMSYLLGRLEVEKLHARLITKNGWSLKQFNDWMLSHGALPYSWIVAASGQ
jgi:uncharacterized protein (DUF885 family)